MLVPGLAFAQAHAPELRVDKDRVRDLAVPDGAVFTPKQVGPQDAKVVVRDVRKGRAALDIADGVDVFGARLEALVHPDVAPVVGFDARRPKVQPLGVGRAPGRGQEVRPGDAPAVPEGQRHPVLGAYSLGVGLE